MRSSSILARRETPTPPASEQSRHSFLKWIAHPYFALGLSLVCGVPLIFFRGVGIYDDSLFLKYGELIAQGFLPYRDFIDYKPPVVLYLSAALTHLFGTQWFVPRIFLFLFATGFAILVVRSLRRLGGEKAAWFAAWILPSTYYIAQGYSFHTEPFGAFFGFAGGMLALTLASRLGFLLAGICCGIAFLCKQPCALYMPAVGAIILVDLIYRKITFRTALENGLLAAIGFCLPTAFYFALFWQIREQAYEGIFNLAAKETHFPFTPKHFAMWLQNPGSLLGCGALALFCFRFRAKSKVYGVPVLRALAFFGTAGFLCLAPTLHGNATPHYLMHAVVFLVGFTALVLAQNQIKERWLRIGFVMFALCFNGAVLAAGVQKWRSGILAFDLQQQREIRAALSSHLLPEDRILAISESSARLYYLSGRLPSVPRLVFYWRKIFDHADALKILERGETPAALWDLTVPYGSPEYEQQLQALAPEISSRYQLLRIEHGWHPNNHQETVILVRKQTP